MKIYLMFAGAVLFSTAVIAGSVLLKIWFIKWAVAL